MFYVRVKRDKKHRFRKQEFIIPINPEDEGFVIEIHHGRSDKTPMKISGFIGDTVQSTTVESKGSPRIKRVTER